MTLILILRRDKNWNCNPERWILVPFLKDLFFISEGYACRNYHGSVVHPSSSSASSLLICVEKEKLRKISNHILVVDRTSSMWLKIVFEPVFHSAFSLKPPNPWSVDRQKLQQIRVFDSLADVCIVAMAILVDTNRPLKSILFICREIGVFPRKLFRIQSQLFDFSTSSSVDVIMAQGSRICFLIIEINEWCPPF